MDVDNKDFKSHLIFIILLFPKIVQEVSIFRVVGAEVVQYWNKSVTSSLPRKVPLSEYLLTTYCMTASFKLMGSLVMFFWKHGADPVGVNIS